MKIIDVLSLFFGEAGGGWGEALGLKELSEIRGRVAGELGLSLSVRLRPRYGDTGGSPFRLAARSALFF